MIFIDIGFDIRSTSSKMWKDEAKSKAAIESFSSDTAKLWNNAPLTIKKCTNSKQYQKGNKTLLQIYRNVAMILSKME